MKLIVHVVLFSTWGFWDGNYASRRAACGRVRARAGLPSRRLDYGSADDGLGFTHFPFQLF